MIGPSARVTLLLLALSLNVIGGIALAAEVQPCGAGSKVTGQVFRVNGSDVVLRSGPSTSTEKLINEKASAILHSTEYLTIDKSVTVREECTQGGWSRVRVTEPDWLRDSHRGWVASTALRGESKDAGGNSEFTEADFNWDATTSKYKKVIVAGVNKVHRENARCKSIDPLSAYLSSSKGTPADPVFFVTCGSGVGAFNVFFSKSDLEKGVSMPAAAHLAKDRAIDLCEAYATSNATHPSTVSFSRVLDLAVSEHPTGRTTVASSFTAKNSFNLELKYKIRCLLDSDGLIQANVAEARVLA